MNKKDGAAVKSTTNTVSCLHIQISPQEQEPAAQGHHRRKPSPSDEILDILPGTLQDLDQRLTSNTSDSLSYRTTLTPQFGQKTVSALLILVPQFLQ